MKPKNYKNKRNPYFLLTKFFLYLTVFLVPIFFLPVTSEIIEFNKAILFYILVSLAAIFWFIDLSLNKEKIFQKTFLFTPIIVFGIIFLIASIFSYEAVYSFVGQNNYYHHSFVSVFFFIVFFFIFVNILKDTKEIKRFLSLIIISSAVSSLIYFLKIIKINFLPWNFFQQIGFNFVSNTINGFAIYLALIVLLSFSFLILTEKKWQKLLLGFYLILNLSLLFFIDLNPAWYVLGGGFAVLLIFLAVKAGEENIKWTSISAFIIAFSILMLFFNSSSAYNIGLVNDITLDQQTSWEITKGSLSKNALFGSGPGTFYFDFFRFRPSSFNESPNWNFNFIKASNEWWQMLSTTGILGFLSFLALFVAYFFFLGKRIGKSKSTEERKLLILFIACLALIFLAGIFYTYSFSLFFLLFVFLALGSAYLVIVEKRKKNYTFEKFKGVFSSLGLSLVIIIAIVVIYLGGRAWLANYYFRKANAAINNKEDLGKVEEYLLKTVENYSWRAGYNLSLAQNYLVRSQLLAQNYNPDANQIQEWVTKAVFYANRAVELDRKNPELYLALASLYQDMDLLTRDDISNQVVDSYNKSINLDKNNPKRYYDLANYYSTRAQSLLNSLSNLSDEEKEAVKKSAQDLFTLAINKYNKAISLKKDYLAAQTARALTYEAKGEIETAVKQLEDLTNKNPFDYSLFYELGRIYLNQDNLEKAENNFKKVISLFPGHSNAHWQLSAIYEKQGKKDLAIKEMEIVEELNPDNEQVKQKLRDLKK